MYNLLKYGFANSAELAVSVAVLFLACYLMATNAVRLSCIQCCGRWSSIHTLFFLFQVIRGGTLSVAFRTPATTAVVQLKSGMTVFALHLTRIFCGWAVTSQYIYLTRNFLQMIRVAAPFVIALMVSLPVFHVIRWCRSDKQFIREDVGLNYRPFMAHPAISFFAHVAKPSPTPAKLWLVLRQWSVFVNMQPKVLLFSEALLGTKFLVSECRHCIQFITFIENAQMRVGAITV